MSDKVPSEHAEQVRVIQWFEANCRDVKGLLFAVPNGAHLAGNAKRRMAQVSSLKAEGLRTGVPDLILPVARGEYHGLAIEMKRQKGGTLSEPQRRWREKLTEQGWLSVVCLGAESAIEVLEKYLEK